MKKRLVIANWKMNPRTSKEAFKLVNDLLKRISVLKKTEVVLCPPYIYLEKLSKISKRIGFGGQDSFWEDVGPFTGEVSGEMLYSLGARHVILGHSERRALGESNDLINKKVKSAISSGLSVVLCVGENMRDHEHAHFEIVKNQILECLSGLSRSSVNKLSIAYEPVWAISSTPDRRDATTEDALEMSIFIRKVLSDLCGVDNAKKINILYGGSVNERDAGDFLSVGGVDGVLVGKASLSPDKFSQIINISENIK